MVRPLLLSLVLLLLASCQQTPPTPAPTPAEPSPSGEPPVTPKGDMSTNYNDAAMAIVTNAREEVFVAGVQGTDMDVGWGTRYGYKLSSQAGPLRLFVSRYGRRAATFGWTRLIDAPCPVGTVVATSCSLRAVELALSDDDSSLVLSGHTQDNGYFGNGETVSGWQSRALLHKLSPDGTVLWQKSVSETENSRPLGLSGAADGASYLLWQAISANPVDFKERYLGVRLSKLGPDGTVLWTKNIETPLSYEETASTYGYLTYFDVADVVLLGDAVIVAGFGDVQAFSTDGEPLWRTALPYNPVRGETPVQDERYYTHTEVVADGDQIYVGRSSERYVELSPAASQRLELTALSADGEVRWTRMLGNEQNYVFGTSLSATAPYGLHIAGTAWPQQEDIDFAPSNFASTLSPDGQNVVRQSVPDDVTIYALAGPEGEETVSTFFVGAIGNSSFNYDTPEFTASDAFLSVGDEAAKN